MPIYYYRCTACNNTFELLQKIGELPPSHGKGCISSDCSLEKQLTAPNFTILSRNPLADVAKRNADMSPSVDQNSKYPSDSSSHQCTTGCALHST